MPTYQTVDLPPILARILMQRPPPFPLLATLIFQPSPSSKPRALTVELTRHGILTEASVMPRATASSLTTATRQDPPLS